MTRARSRTGGSAECARRLTWNYPNEFAGGIETPDRGPTDAGRTLVRRFAVLGVLLDLAHASDQTWRDVIDEEVPFSVTHAGCRAVLDHPRNLAEWQLEPGMPRLPSDVGVPVVGGVESRVRASAGKARVRKPGRGRRAPAKKARVRRRVRVPRRKVVVRVAPAPRVRPPGVREQRRPLRARAARRRSPHARALRPRPRSTRTRRRRSSASRPAERHECRLDRRRGGRGDIRGR